VSAYIFTIAGSFLASYNNAQWVPAAAAIAAAIKAVNEYQSLEQSIPITNNAIQREFATTAFHSTYDTTLCHFSANLTATRRIESDGHVVAATQYGNSKQIMLMNLCWVPTQSADFGATG
jgi:hypothetical protein